MLRDILLEWPAVGLVAAFVASAAVIALLGSRLTRVADQLADRTHLGEALMGGVFLGAVTSISGSVLSVTAAWNGEAHLAMSNAFGGIAAQTAFLVIVDLLYRPANLEHAAASHGNVMQGALLVCLLAVVLATAFAPDWTFAGIHPGTPILLLGYAGGIWLVKESKEEPMWRPEPTRETRVDEPDVAHEQLSLSRLWTGFLLLGTGMAIAGWFLEHVASGIVHQTQMSGVVMGLLFTSISTSLPELVTTIVAVRRGALTLAVSGIIGGNAYDVLFAAFSDVAYREGSIYHTLDGTVVFWIAISVLMTSVLILGLLRRQRRGVANIGFEGALVLALYVLAVIVLAVDGV